MSSVPLTVGVDLGGSGYRIRAVRVVERRPLVLEVDERREELEESWDDGFEPIALERQLSERGQPRPTATEEETSVERIRALVAGIRHVSEGRPCRVAIAAPGLKSADRRGIVAARYGPRDPVFLDRLLELGDAAFDPAARLVGDGLAGARGEQTGMEGLLRGVETGLYLAGGSGVAEALVLGGRAHELDTLEPPPLRAFEIPLPGEEEVTYQDALAPRRLLESADGLGSPAERERFAATLFGLIRRRVEEVAELADGAALQRVVLAQAFAFLPATFLAACRDAAALVELRLSSLRAAPSIGAVALALDHEDEIGERAWTWPAPTWS